MGNLGNPENEAILENLDECVSVTKPRSEDVVESVCLTESRSRGEKADFRIFGFFWILRIFSPWNELSWFLRTI